MNGIVAVMLVFLVIGFVDYLTGNHLGIGAGYDMGMKQLGDLVMLVIGFYAIGSVAAKNSAAVLRSALGGLPFDPSVLISMVLETSMGGYPIAKEIARTPELALFSGMLVGAGIGCLVCFTMPVLLVIIDKRDMGVMMKGLIPGILATPVGLILGGVLYGLDGVTLLVNMIPVLAVCVLLVYGVSKHEQGTQKILMGLGLTLKGLAQGTSLLVILGLFIPALQVVPPAMATEAITMMVKMTGTLAGGMVLSQCIMHYGNGVINRLAAKAGVNAYSMLGLLLVPISPMIMYPMYKFMDLKGKLMNAAFSVMGAYVIGGQMAFVSQVTTSYNLAVFMAAKLAAGAGAIFLAVFMQKKQWI